MDQTKPKGPLKPQENPPTKTPEPPASTAAASVAKSVGPQNPTSSLNPTHTLTSGDDPRNGGGDEGEKREEKPPITAAASGSATDIEKKLRRAERFGMPVQLSEEEKRRTRAERFGMGSPLHGIKDVGNQEEQKRKARAERFGLAVHTPVDEEAKKKARLERFGEKSQNLKSNVSEEKMKARAARFSQPSSASSEANGKAKSDVKTDIVDTTTKVGPEN